MKHTKPCIICGARVLRRLKRSRTVYVCDKPCRAKYYTLLEKEAKSMPELPKELRELIENEDKRKVLEKKYGVYPR